MTNLDSILKSREITLPTKVCLVKAMFFPVVMYGCESWTIKKAECRQIDAFELVLKVDCEGKIFHCLCQLKQYREIKITPQTAVWFIGSSLQFCVLKDCIEVAFELEFEYIIISQAHIFMYN